MTVRPTTRAWFAAVPLTLGVLLSPLTGAPAQAADNGSWSVAPTTAHGGLPRQYFIYDLAPGVPLHDSVTITNELKVPQTFDVYATDAFTTATDGGLGFRSVSEPQDGVGAWTTVGKRRVTVPPRQSVSIPFTLTVPVDAPPGDAVGAIVGLNTLIQTGTGDGAQIGVQKAVAARIYARVQGPTSPGLEVRDVAVDRSTSPVTVTYTLANIGNIRLEPTTTVVAHGLLSGDLQVLAPEQHGTLLPGESSQFSTALKSLPVVDHLTVTVAAAADQVAATGQAPVWLVPWWLLLLLALLLAAVIALWAWRRRSRQGDGPGGRRHASNGPPGPTTNDEVAHSDTEVVTL